jgi:hypothetical protein
MAGIFASGAPLFIIPYICAPLPSDALSVITDSPLPELTE